MSVTLQVTTVVPTGNRLPPGIPVAVTPARLIPQLSLAAGAVNTITLEHPAIVGSEMSAGSTMVGSSLSVTVTGNVQELVLPELSATVTVTIVVPTGKNDPGACDWL